MRFTFAGQAQERRPGEACKLLDLGIRRRYRFDLQARLGDGSSQSVVVNLGNDAPAIRLLPPKDEVSGNARFTVQLSDTSGDLVSVEVEFKEQGGVFRPARPAGAGLEDVKTPDDGSWLQKFYFWDTDADGRMLNVWLRPFRSTT